MLYVVAGNGTGPTKEISAALKDLKDKATKDDAEFWLLVEGKDEPSTTDNAIIKWLTTNEIWFEVVTSTGTTYDGAQDTAQAEDVYAAMLERIQERAAESEEAALLILPVDPDGETDDDETLMTLVEQAIDADVSVFALNGEMAKITLDDEPQPDEPEEAPVPAKAATKKAATKAAPAPTKKAAAPTKAVAKKAAAPPAEEQDGAPNDDEAEAESTVYTADELAKMTVPELGAIARAQGVDSKGLGKKDLITAITQQTAPVTPDVIASNGDVALVVIHLPGQIITKFVTAEEALALAAQ